MTQIKHQNLFQLTLLVFLVLFSPLAIDIYLPALTLISETFHVKHSLVQGTITWFLIAMGVGQLFAGPLADKYGRKKIALGGVCIYGFSAYLAWLSISIEWLLLARVMQGVGACATSVAAFSAVCDIYGAKESGKMISYLNGAICFIPALAPVLGSFLTQEFGWRSNFSFMLIFASVTGLALLLGMKETHTVKETQGVFKIERYADVLLNPSFLFHASLCMLAMAVILAYVTSAPIVLIEQMGISMNQFTFWFGLNASINILAAFIGPKLMEKKGTYTALGTGICLMLLSALLMILLPSQVYPWAFMLPIFISSIGFALILGSSAGMALAPFGDKAGTAAALLGLFQMTGAGVVVGIVGLFELSAQPAIAFHMLLLMPGLIILGSKTAKRWHESYSS